MSGAVMSTLSFENTFNDLRGNEQRAARHKGRSPPRMQAVQIASVAHRVSAHRPLVDMGPEDVQRFKGWHCRPGAFD
eukprot:7362571-Alexandrium_andersonii.AAC.1